jgi:hypothetical protein
MVILIILAFYGLTCLPTARALYRRWRADGGKPLTWVEAFEFRKVEFPAPHGFVVFASWLASLTWPVIFICLVLIFLLTAGQPLTATEQQALENLMKQRGDRIASKTRDAERELEKINREIIKVRGKLHD